MSNFERSLAVTFCRRDLNFHVKVNVSEVEMAYMKDSFYVVLLAVICVHCNRGYCSNCNRGYCSNTDQSIGIDLLFQSELEEFEDEPLTFTKSLPSWLQGNLVRNGSFYIVDFTQIYRFDMVSSIYQ